MNQLSDRWNFAAGVMRDLRTLESLEEKRLNLSQWDRPSVRARSIETGHPDYAALPLDASASCHAAAVFIDLEDFTGRTFWDSPEEVVRLAQAVLGQVAEIVTSYGGHVLGLRGDGLFACFGPNPNDPAIDVALALGAGAFALDATQSALNELLKQSGIRPVQLRVGADYGRLDFVRTGTDEVSEVNIVGFAANFAAKCEKYASSWEFVVGQGLQQKLPRAADLFQSHEKSPKRYTRDYETRTYSFHQFSWRQVLPHLSEIKSQLAGHPSSSVRIF